MSGAFLAAALWGLVATLAALGPRRWHWRAAYGLIGSAVPILVWIGAAHGWKAALLVGLGAASVLRWPLKYLWRWLRRG